MSYKSINKTLKYSIRKLAVGATPVVIGTFLLAGGTTALASEGSGSNVSINYVADSELTDYEKSLVKQGIPEELKNGETYYLVYKNESYLQKNKLPDTGSTSLPLKGIGFATALLTVVLVSKKNRNKILGIVLIGALGQSVVLPDFTFALENNLLARYNHIVSVNSKFEENLISIDGYKYIGYVTSQDIEVKLENKKDLNQGNVTENHPFEIIKDEEKEQGTENNTKEHTKKRLNSKENDNTLNDNIIEKEKSAKVKDEKKDSTSNNDIKKINEEKENNLKDEIEKEKSEKIKDEKKDEVSNNTNNINEENVKKDKVESEKIKVEKNLTDIVKNNLENIPLPIIVEEVLSETIRYEDLEIEEIGNIDVSNENKSNKAKTDYLVNTKDINKLSMNSPTELQTFESNKIEKTTTESKVQSTLEDKKNASIGNNSDKVVDIAIRNNSKSVTYENESNNDDKTNGTVNSLNKNSNSENSNIINKRAKTKRKVKVVERVIKVTETIPYKVVYVEDENMENGTTKVIKDGSVGKKVSIQKVVLNNDEELKREITSSTIKQKEVDKVIKVGTKGIKKSDSKSEVSRIEEVKKTKLIPKKETIYTEIVENKHRKYEKDYPKIQEATKNLKNNIGLLTTQNDKLSTINITNIFDDSLFEGERRFENLMMYYVQSNLKRKREYENEKEVEDTIISKQVPVVTGVMRIGTRKHGFETLKDDGKIVNISSNLDEKEIKDMKLSNNNSFILDKDVPGYLGSAINVSYEKDFKNTKLGLGFDVNKIQANSTPTIYHYDKHNQQFKPLKTKILGNIAYADIKESGVYTVVDKNKQDEVRKSEKGVVYKDINDSKVKNINENGTGRSIVFVIDNGGFITGDDKSGLRKIIPKRIMQQLDPKKDKVSVVDFNNKTMINKALTSNFTDISKALDGMTTDWWMPGEYWAAGGISAGIERLLEDKDNGNKKHIFLLVYASENEQEYLRVLKKAKENNIAITVLSLDSVNEVMLKKMANETGGKFYIVKRIEDVPDNFNPFDENIEQNNMDINKDGISPYYTREILKGNLRLSTGKESPYFKKQIKDAREKISKEFNIEINDINAINKKIDGLKDEYIESLLSADYDNDNLVNNNEVRPEKDLDGKTFLYALSDPENADTDGDGIRDDKDESTDIKLEESTDKKTPKTIDIETIATDLDTDGDGYSDVNENFYLKALIDDFGVEYSSVDWNVGVRDLLMFSDLAYYDFKVNDIGMRLIQIAAKAWGNKEYGDAFLNKKYFNREIFNDLNVSGRNSKDSKFFDNWRFLGRTTVPYYGIVNSDVSWFKNGKNLVIAFRGTDEGGLELMTDAGILRGKTLAANTAESQIEYILKDVTSENNRFKYPVIENIYITGHSLGGYQAYYAFLKAYEKFKNKKNDPNGILKFVERISVVNFNGPGLVYRTSQYDELENIYKENNNSVRSYEVDADVGPFSGDLNKAIVNGFGHLVHPNKKMENLAFLKDRYKTSISNIVNKTKEKLQDVAEKISPFYPHKLDSFYAHISQGERNTQNKFVTIGKDLFDRVTDKVRSALHTVEKGVISAVDWVIEKMFF